MEEIPSLIAERYQVFLEHEKGLIGVDFLKSRKWLRFYLDFCHKYKKPRFNQASLTAFLAKLTNKGTDKQQCQQARQAIVHYYEMAGHAGVLASQPPNNLSVQKNITHSISNKNTPSSQQLAKNADNLANQLKLQNIIPGKNNEDEISKLTWPKVYEELTGIIKLRHYSRKTLQLYRAWVRKFQRFLHDKPPTLVEVDDVKAYLTWLAVEKNVAASTQNQAFNACSFCFAMSLVRSLARLMGLPGPNVSLISRWCFLMTRCRRLLACYANPTN